MQDVLPVAALGLGGLVLGALGSLLALRGWARMRGSRGRGSSPPPPGDAAEAARPDSAGSGEAFAHVIRQLGESRQRQAEARKRGEELETACAELERQVGQA